MPPVSELGPDALFEQMTLEKFTESLHKRKTEIKALLLDQVLNYSFITSNTLYFTHLLICLLFEFIILLLYVCALSFLYSFCIFCVWTKIFCLRSQDLVFFNQVRWDT